jgi:ABC-type glycerol-3-phosphate transport system permease component
MVINSIKLKLEYLGSKFNLPYEPTLRNFHLVISDFQILIYFRNTFFVIIPSMIFTVMLGVFASYAFAKLRFRARSLMYVAMLATMFMPGQVSIIPAYVMFSRMGLANNFGSVILSYIAGSLPGAILLMTNYFMGISNEMIDSAKIDGAEYFSVVRNIIIPMGAPAIAINIIFSFIAWWNDLFTPMIYLSNPNRQTVMVALNRLVTRNGSDPTMQMAGFVLSILPVLFIYLFMQKFIMRGLTEGSIK